MDVLRIETRCNQNCLFCGADPRNLGDYTLDFASLKRAVDAAGADELLEVSGGEPTLSPLLPKLLLYAKTRGRRVSLQTNAMRFSDPAFAGAMQKAGLSQVFVSLHAPDARLSDAMTRRPGAFDLTVRGVENLLELGLNVSLNYVICRPNASRMTDYVRFVRERFGDKTAVVFSYINPFHNAWKTPKLIPPISEIAPPLGRALEEGERLGLELHVPDICGIPLCFLAGRERFADKYSDLQHNRPFHPHPQKLKEKVCGTCVWDRVCDGLWERYVEREGLGELCPMTVLPSDFRGSLPAGVQVRSPAESSPPGRVRDTALLVGESCPNDCVFCNEGGRRARRRAMSLAEAERLLKATRPHWVFLSGGEPTTCPDLERYVRLAREYGAEHVTLVSNGGSLARADFARKIVFAGVDEVRLSVHGPNAALHDALTQNPGSFRGIKAACGHLNGLKEETNLHTVALVVVNRRNLEHLEATVKTLFSLGFDKIGLGMIEPRNSALERFSELVPRLTEAARAVETLFANLPKPWPDVYVDSLPHCLVANPEIPLGERSVIETLDHEGKRHRVMEEDRDKIFGPPCESCSARGRCEGVFRAYAERYGFEELRRL